MVISLSTVSLDVYICMPAVQACVRLHHESKWSNTYDEGQGFQTPLSGLRRFMALFVFIRTWALLLLFHYLLHDLGEI